MTYKKLSDAVASLANPQRSDVFIKHFRDAVREGKFEAAYLNSERFDMPKQFTRRGKEETYRRSSREMIFEVTPAYEEWFENKNRELAVLRKGGNIKPSVETIEAGLVDFKALAEQTRQKMQASYDKGQSLGKARRIRGDKKK